MVNKLLIINYLVMILFIGSCAYVSVPTNIKKKYTYCYDEDTTEIKTDFNMEGYYRTTNHFVDMVGEKTDTVAHNIMFFKDGTFVSGFYDTDRRRKEVADVSKYLEEIASSPDNEQSKNFYSWFYWGTYEVDDDTIKAQCINHPPALNPYWYFTEIWYKIIDEETIVEIFHKSLHFSDSESKSKNDIKLGEDKYQFVPLKIKPETKFWLKNEKWFWCDEAEYEEWKSNVK